MAGFAEELPCPEADELREVGRPVDAGASEHRAEENQRSWTAYRHGTAGSARNGVKC